MPSSRVRQMQRSAQLPIAAVSQRGVVTCSGLGKQLTMQDLLSKINDC